MQIEWTSNAAEPYLFRQAAEWTGVKVHRARVLPGRMLEEEACCHELNITVSGHFVAERRAASGKFVKTKSGEGTLCLTPSGQTVGAYWQEPLDNLGILLAPDFVRTVALENRFSTAFELREIYAAKDPLVEHLGLALLDEAHSPTPAGRLYTDSLIQTLTLHLLRNYSDAAPVPENTSGGLSGYRLKRVREFIDAHLDADISLQELARIADLSQFHFARAFRRSMGETPQQYLMRQRIERAKQLLAGDELPIVEVGLRTGFKNQSHFTTLFRKFTKYTPKLWRELERA
ncbi:MAG: helix-turn-helix transcriptional regulator [Acidobacteria bacterium]|nr:helix-turn-helix transcriptional regulator [Acidobacteriota bacterium]